MARLWLGAALWLSFGTGVASTCTPIGTTLACGASQGKTWETGFLAMIERLKAVYPYTKHRSIDWDSVKTQYLPLIKAAETAESPAQYYKAIKEMIAGMRDGHVYAAWNVDDADHTCAADPHDTLQTAQIGGSFGVMFDLVEQQLRITYVRDGLDISPFKLWDVVSHINGKPVADVLTATPVPMWSDTPAATDENVKIEQVKYLSRGKDGDTLVIKGEAGEKTIAMLEEGSDAAIDAIFAKELKWLKQKSFPKPGPSCTVSHMKSGYGYLQLGTFSTCPDQAAAVKKAIAEFKTGGMKGIVVDFRGNGGGDDANVPAVLAYFYSSEYQYEQTVLKVGFGEAALSEQTESCSDCGDTVTTAHGEFLRATRYRVVPAPEGDRWDATRDGKIAVLINRGVMSNGDMAVALFARIGADIVGAEGTSGSASMAGGKINIPCMTIGHTAAQSWDPDGKIQLESNGKVGGTLPTKRYPTTKEAVLAHQAWLVHESAGTPAEQRPTNAKEDPLLSFAQSLLTPPARCSTMKATDCTEGNEKDATKDTQDCKADPCTKADDDATCCKKAATSSCTNDMHQPIYVACGIPSTGGQPDKVKLCTADCKTKQEPCQSLNIHSMISSMCQATGGEATTTACSTSDTTAIAGSACKCATSSPTNECAVGKYCWADNTCNSAAKATVNPNGNACTCTNGTPKTGADCTADGASMCAGCNAGFAINGDQTACEAEESKPTATATATGTSTSTAAATGTSTSTAAASTSTKAAAKKVKVVLVLAGLDYDKVKNDASFKQKLTDGLKDSYLASLPSGQGYTKDSIDITYESGSVKATVAITPPASANAADLKSTLSSKKESIENAAVTKIKAMPEVGDFLEANKAIADLQATSSAPEVIAAPTTTTAAPPTTTGSSKELAASHAASLVSGAWWLCTLSACLTFVH